MSPGASGPLGASRWVPWAERALLAVLMALFVVRGLGPAWRKLDTDFPNYYLAAKLYRAGYPLERFYDWAWFQRQKDHAGITDQALVGYIPLTYFSALVVAPLTSLSPLAAKHAWLAVNLGLLGATAAALQRLTRLGPVRVGLVMFLAVVPLRTSFQFGQQHVLLLALLALAAWLDARGRQLTSGGVLACAAALKLYPALFALYFIRKRRFRALAGLLAGLVVLGLLAVQLFGADAIHRYVTDVLPRGLHGENNDPYGVGQGSPTALLRRLLVREPELNPEPLVDAPVLFAVLQPVAQALILVPGLWWMTAGRPGPRRDRLEWGAYVTVLLTMSTATATYHFAALILATALTAGALFEQGRARVAWCVIALHALVCLPLSRFVPESPSGWLDLASFPRLYSLLALFGVTLYALATTPPEPTPRNAQAWVAAGATFAAMVLTGITSNVRHLRGVDATSATRLAHAIPTILATTPSVAEDEVYFVRLDLEGGVLDRSGQRGLHVAPVPGTDLLFPAVTERSSEGWVELSSSTSRVVRFPRGASTLAAAAWPVEVENAEQPAVSRDGRWLAFLRDEDRGHRDLWMKELRPGAVERRVTGAPHDVRDVCFLVDGRTIVSAGGGLRSRLFVGALADESFVEVQTADGEVRYPAASPDGEWLAYARNEDGRFQLWVMSLASGGSRRLTDGDCNGTEPAWFEDSKRLVFATDCGRGLAHTALAVLRAVP